MADKKFYYLQLESALFSNMKMMMLDKQRNRKDLMYFLIQLSVLSISNEGKLLFDDEPATIEDISMLTGEMEDDVESMLNTLTKLKLISKDDNTYYIEFAAERIGSITDRALRKQREKARKQSGTKTELNGTLAETERNISGKSSAEVPQYKSKSNNKSIELEKESEIKKEKKQKKDDSASKDALDVYDYYKSHIKSGERKKALDRLPKILSKHSKDELIKSIDNYITSKQGETNMKYYKAAGNFFNAVEGFYYDYLPSEYVEVQQQSEKQKAMQKEIVELKERPACFEHGDWTDYGLIKLQSIKARYNNREDDKNIIEAEFKVVGGQNGFNF